MKEYIVTEHPDFPYEEPKPQELIRCKDCKHYYVLNEVRGNCSEYNFVEKIPIDYCSWAERKDNG